MLKIYSKAIELYIDFIYRAIIIFMFVLIITVGLQISGRYIFFIPRYLWTIEISNFCLIWIIFLGSIIGVKERKHFCIDIFYNIKLGPLYEVLFQSIYYFVLMSISLVFIIFGYRFFQNGLLQTSELTELNLGTIYISVPFTGISWLLILLNEILRRFDKE